MSVLCFLIFTHTYYTNACGFLKSILIFLPQYVFQRGLLMLFYSVINMGVGGCSWKFPQVKQNHHTLSSAVVQALFNKKYPLHFNGCHIPQLAACAFMWSILCILFSLAHQVHLKAAQSCFIHLCYFIVFLLFGLFRKKRNSQSHLSHVRIYTTTQHETSPNQLLSKVWLTVNPCLISDLQLSEELL